MKTFGYVILGILALGLLVGVSFTCNLLGIGAKHIENSVQNAVISYDEYENIYAACKKANTDLGNLEVMSENDKMFDQISKGQRIMSAKTILNNLVESYNAKSKHIDKKYWKRNDLPTSLDVNQFSNYK